MGTAPDPAPDAVLDDLRSRLRRTRRIALPDGVGWDRGTDAAFLEDLLRAWEGFDWRPREERLLALPWVTTANGNRLLHLRSAAADAPVVVLLHGWPDSFLRFERVLPLLRDVHVVVPCLPGYPFGRPTTSPGTSTSAMAAELADAVAELGHTRYVVSGGDVGSNVAESWAALHPDRVAALHLTDLPYAHIFQIAPDDLTEAEREYLDVGRAWQLREGAYALEQATKPHTLAVGLGDSPAGLAAWLVEKLRAWSGADDAGDLAAWSTDELLTWLTLYWTTGAIGTSFGPYVERPEPVTEPVRVPTAVTIFPGDLVNAPRSFGERFFDIRSWDEEPDGGHFGAWERPEAFVRGVRKALTLGGAG